MVVNRKPDIIIGSRCGREFRPDQAANRPLDYDIVAIVKQDHLIR